LQFQRPEPPPDPQWTADDYRRIALGLDGVIEAEHMGHPDFRVGRQDLRDAAARFAHGSRDAVAEDQARFVAEAPQVFSPETGAWGRAGSTRVQLEPADEEIVGEALTVAWRRPDRALGGAEAAPGRPPKRTGARKAAKQR
jgi:hypothetical protein